MAGLSVIQKFGLLAAHKPAPQSLPYTYHCPYWDRKLTRWNQRVQNAMPTHNSANKLTNTPHQVGANHDAPSLRIWIYNAN